MVLRRLPLVFTLPAGEFRLVYVYRRGTEVLYVGQSRTGLSRPLSAGHHVRAFGVELGDEIDIYRVPDGVSLDEAEGDAIRALKPKWNRVTLSASQRSQAKRARRTGKAFKFVSSTYRVVEATSILEPSGDV
jgi:hypothetical protein